MKPAPNEPSQTSMDLRAANPDLFPSPLELSRDKGPIGKLLRRIPERILKEAGRWPDPWGFLRGVPGVSSTDSTVFESAASANNGWLRLTHMAKGTATLNTDWDAELRQAVANGNQAMLEHATRKCFAAMWRYELFRADVPSEDERIQDEFRQRGVEARRQLVKRGRRAEAERGIPLPGNAELRQFRLEFMLVEWWVRCGESGVPGLMFWGNAAITEALRNLLNRPQLTPAAVKRARRNLGLVPASEKTPFVWRVNVWRRNEREWKILGKQRNGSEAFSFWGTIVFNNQNILPPASVPTTPF